MEKPTRDEKKQALHLLCRKNKMSHFHVIIDMNATRLMYGIVGGGVDRPGLGELLDDLAA